APARAPRTTRARPRDGHCYPVVLARRPSESRLPLGLGREPTAPALLQRGAAAGLRPGLPRILLGDAPRADAALERAAARRPAPPDALGVRPVTPSPCSGRDRRRRIRRTRLLTGGEARPSRSSGRSSDRRGAVRLRAACTRARRAAVLLAPVRAHDSRERARPDAGLLPRLRRVPALRWSRLLYGAVRPPALPGQLGAPHVPPRPNPHPARRGRRSRIPRSSGTAAIARFRAGAPPRIGCRRRAPARARSVASPPPPPPRAA